MKHVQTKLKTYWKNQRGLFCEISACDQENWEGENPDWMKEQLKIKSQRVNKGADPGRSTVSRYAALTTNKSIYILNNVTL